MRLCDPIKKQAMTNTKRRIATLLLALTFPLWVIPVVAIWVIGGFLFLIYCAAAEAVEMIEEIMASKK